VRPELQVQNLALACEKIIADVESLHRREVARDNLRRDIFGDLRRRVVSLLDQVQSLSANLKPGSILLVPGSNPGIEIPAIVIETIAALSDHTPGYRPNIVKRAILKVEKAYHHIRNLNSGIVNVVMDLDRLADRLQNSGRRITKHCVANVTDVRGLVRVDRGMFDNQLPSRRRFPRRCHTR